MEAFLIVDQLVEEYDYDKFQKDVQRLASNYREELKAYEIGESHDGREIYMLEIGHGPIPVIITAGVHARETINTKVVMAMIENYLELAINGEVAISDFGMRDRLNIIHSRPRYGKVFYELNPDEYRNELDQLRYGNPVSILYDTAESKRETGQRLRNQRIEKEFPDRYTQEIIYAGPKNGVNNGENMSLSDIVIRDRIPYIANTNKNVTGIKIFHLKLNFLQLVFIYILLLSNILINIIYFRFY